VWWRSVLGVVFGLSLFLLITTVISQALVTLFWATTAGNQPYRDYFSRAFAFELPLGMLSVNLGLAALIPISWGLMVAIHHMRPSWLSSVQPRIRWRYLFGCLGIAAVVLNGVMLLSTTLGETLSFQPQKGFWAFLAVIVLTSPIQAAAEEIFFRGYLLQALGSLVARPWFGVIVSAVVFALLHGTQNLPLFIDRLGFALLAGLAHRRPGSWHRGTCDQQRVRVPDCGADDLNCRAQGDQGNWLGRCGVRRRWLRALCRIGVRPVTLAEAAHPC
jgi:membrane protease YdiL (CAAX protease family)